MHHAEKKGEGAKKEEKVNQKTLIQCIKSSSMLQSCTIQYGSHQPHMAIEHFEMWLV